MPTAKGQVLDSKSLVSIPGVNVAEYKNNKLIGGTITDLSGNFNMEIGNGSVVRFTAIGYGMNQPLLHDGVLETVYLVPKAYDQAEVTITAKRTYYKYYVAALVVVIAAYVYYKYQKG